MRFPTRVRGRPRLYVLPTTGRPQGGPSADDPGAHPDEPGPAPMSGIERALNRLEHLLQRQRQFASDASHQLRTPLAAMRLNLEEALLYPNETDPHVALAQALHNAERMQNVINDLLSLAHSVPRQTAQREYLDLSSLVRMEAARHPAGRIHAELEQGITVLGEPALLAHLLSNLFKHAELCFAATIAVRLSRTNGHAVLTVTRHCDDREDRSDNAHWTGQRPLDTLPSHEADHRGPGMTLARDIAFAHDGTLLSQETPHGSRFICRLPVTDRPDPSLRPG